jgi:hypothetical protein
MPIHGYPGNVITANPTAPTVSSASGVWTTEQQLQAVSQGNWPGYEYPISRSLRFNSADSAYLNRTPASAGNQQKWTWSGWVKRSTLGAKQIFGAGAGTAGSPECFIDFEDNFNFQIFDGTSNLAVLRSSAVYRDPSAWYHAVVAVDTTQATASNRVLMYINGQQITAFTLSTYPSQNLNTQVNATTAHRISSSTRVSAYYYDGYLTEINFIDGQALDPSSFGLNDPETGVWSPKRYTGTYGTNGFYLNFSDNSNTTAATLGKDYSGNGNNWTPNNFSVTAGAGNDSLVDSPTSYGTDTGVGGEVRGNYCTLNPNDRGASQATLSNGNLDATCATGTSYFWAKATASIPQSGGWYMEVTLPTVGSFPVMGLVPIAKTSGMTTTFYVGELATEISWFGGLNGIYQNETNILATSALSANDVIMIAHKEGKTWFGRNGTWINSGDPANGTGNLGTTLTNEMCFAISLRGTTAPILNINFGQRPFAYTAPSGFKALCTQNLPTPTIGATSTTQANDYMNVVLYTGNGSTQSITGVGFQPDFVWCKSRSSGVTNHALFDVVRGADLWLGSNLTNAEINGAGTFLTSFNSDGFSVGSGAVVNTNAGTYVAWNWKANGAGSSNTAGTITSTVSANTTSGFSIVTYTGTGANATVGHGLGVAPSMVIAKLRSNTSNWPVYHRSLDAGKVVWLDLTDAQTTSVSYNGAPTSSIINLGTAGGTNTSSGTHVIYAFAAVAGYSAFGSFTGNGSTDGPFVYTGFKPRWIMIKNATAAGNAWLVFDTVRDTYNVTKGYLAPNNANSENTSSSILDITSNGFKLRDSFVAWNGSGDTFIYAAFAENPFKYSLAR